MRGEPAGPGEAGAAMTAATTQPHDTPREAGRDDVITMGRIGVDVYPLQVGTSLRYVDTFG